MKKIKIFRALDRLGTYELNRFIKYVNSPYFNSSDALKQIVQYYEAQRRKDKEGFLDKNNLWNIAFPTKDFNDGRLRKALSDLLKLFEDFLCQELLERKPIQRATLLMEAIEHRQLDTLYNSSMKRASQLTQDNTDVSAQLHYHRFQAEKSYYQLTDFDFKRTEKSNLGNIVNSLDYFYLAEKLKYYCTGISQKAFIQHEYDYLFIDEIKEHIRLNRYPDIPIVNIWISIFFLQTSEDSKGEGVFQEFKKTFNEIISLIPQKEAAQIFTYGQNYCIKRINSGSPEYFQQLFNLNQKALDNAILFEGDNMDPWVFRNIVTVALRLKEFKWTTDFIDEYGNYISESFRLNAVNYSSALLNFYQSNYTLVLDHLNTMEIMDLSYELNTRSLLILTYYEMKETDALSSLLDSFSVYLNRHKDISKARRDNYTNMISFTRRLMNTLPSDQKAHKKMLAKLEETKGIASGAWLKEKIQERLK